MTIRLVYELLFAIVGVFVGWKLILKPLWQLTSGIRKQLPKPIPRAPSAKQLLTEAQRNLDEAKMRLEAAHLEKQALRHERQRDQVIDEMIDEAGRPTTPPPTDGSKS